MANICERIVTINEEVDVGTIADILGEKMYRFASFEYMRLFPGQTMSDTEYEVIKKLILEELK